MPIGTPIITPRIKTVIIKSPWPFHQQFTESIFFIFGTTKNTIIIKLCFKFPSAGRTFFNYLRRPNKLKTRRTYSSNAPAKIYKRNSFFTFTKKTICLFCSFNINSFFIFNRRHNYLQKDAISMMIDTMPI